MFSAKKITLGAWIRVIALAGCLSLGLGACRGGPLTSRTPAPSPGATAPKAPAAPAAPQPLSPFAAQAQRGVGLYAQRCARCHGASGEGSTAGPILVGPGALPLNPPPGRQYRKGQFRTAMDLGMFIKSTMPPGGPHLPPTDVAAVMAFVLQANGITPTQAMSPSTAGSVPLGR